MQLSREMSTAIRYFLLGAPVPLYVFFHMLSHTEIDTMILLVISLLLCAAFPYALYRFDRKFPSHKLSSGCDDTSAKMSVRSKIVMGISSVISMLVLTQSSPLYPMNTWCDPNIYRTVAKSMLNGSVLYRDIFDQKGPFIFFIYGLGSLVSGSSFTGIFIIEALCCFLVLLFTYKIVGLYTRTGIFTDILTVILPIVLYSNHEFEFGGSPEELMMPVYAAVLYLGLKGIKESRLPADKEALVIGILAGLILWIKYTLCGIFLGFALFIIISAVQKRDFRRLGRVILFFFTGLVIITLPVLLYFACNGALKSLWDTYFYENLFVYAAAKDTESDAMPPFVRLIFTFVYYFASCDIDIFILTFAGAFFLSVQKRKGSQGFLAAVIITSVIGVFIGGYNISYYILILYTFCILSLVPLNCLMSKYFSHGTARRAAIASLAVLGITASFIAFFRSKSTYLILTPRENLPQYKFAQIINGSEDSSMINYHNLDLGFYFASGTLPELRHYCYNTDEFEIYGIEQVDALNRREAHFYICSEDYPPFDGYTLVSEASLDSTFTGRIHDNAVYYLYERED